MFCNAYNSSFLGYCRDIAVDAYPADWELYGKRAGSVRNAKILRPRRQDSCRIMNTRGQVNLTTANYRHKPLGNTDTNYLDTA